MILDEDRNWLPRRALQNFTSLAQSKIFAFWDFCLIFTAQGPFFVGREVHHNDRLAKLYKISKNEVKIKLSIF